MHNKVVFRAAKAALDTGLPTLRFNFRGVGRSAGTFASGIGERGDVRAALDFLSARFPGLPVCVIGFSFGSWVGLEVGASQNCSSRGRAINSDHAPKSKHSMIPLLNLNTFTGSMRLTTFSQGNLRKCSRSYATSS
jgi:alpha/beta superfamily hydrolase